MKKPLLRSALVASTLAAVLLPAAAADAATLKVVDARDDTWSMDMTTDQPVKAGSQINVDLVRTTVKHSAGKVTVTSGYVDLKKTTNRFGLDVRFRTNKGLKREVVVETLSRATWGGSHHLSKPNGDPVPCKGLTHAIDYTANTVTVSVPRACLGTPRWVQASIYALGFEDTTAADGSVYYDNGHSTSSKTPGWTAKIRRG